MIHENCPPLVFDANTVPINTGIRDVKKVPGLNDDRYCLARVKIVVLDKNINEICLDMFHDDDVDDEKVEDNSGDDGDLLHDNDDDDDDDDVKEVSSCELILLGIG